MIGQYPLGMLGTDLGKHGAGSGGGTINISAGTFPAASAQGTAIGTLSVSGGTGTYIFTLTDSHTNAVQVTGTSLQVGSASSAASSFSITVHADNGAGSTLNGTFLITALVAATATWQTLKVGGGGWMRGIDSVGDTLLARSDTHPALYRFDATANKWLPLITAFSMPTAYVESYGTNAASGVWAARIAPSTPSKFYMIYGGDNQYPFVSTNSGGTWALANGTGWPTDAMNANGGDAQQNHRMAVDPANDAVVYVGTPTQGLQKTSNSGGAWATDTGVTASASIGIAIAFDPTSSVSGGKTQGIFAASQGQGVWHSTNGGTGWTKLNTTGMPTSWLNMIVDQTGKLWIADGTNLKSWTSGTGWVTSGMTDNPAAVCVDPGNANHVLSCSQGGRFYKSTDGGATFPQTSIISTTVTATDDALWQAWGPTAGYSGGGSGYSAGSYALSASNFVFDASGNVYFAYGFGIWKQATATIFNGNSTSIAWNAFSRGIEALDATSIVHPPGGNAFGTAWDLISWNFVDPAVYPSTYGPDADYDGPMPNYGVNLVRGFMGEYASSDSSFMTMMTAVGGFYSPNRGVNWTKFSGTTPFGSVFQGGCIASLSPTEHVVMCVGRGIDYTGDNGATWTAATYAGAGYDSFPFFYSNYLAADRVTAGAVYALSKGDGIYKSTNSGATFSKALAFTTATGLARIKAVPGHAGHVFLVIGNSLNAQPVSSAVLMWTTNAFGSAMSTLSDFQSVEDVGFGTIVSGQTYPTIYIAAYRTSTTTYGVYKCNNFNPSTGAGTWTLMTNADGSNYPEGWFAAISGVAGDPAIDNRCSLSYTNGGFKHYA